MSKIKSIIHENEKVNNQDRRFGSNLEYFPCLIADGRGNINHALFTKHQINEALKRAKRNPEDIPRDESFWAHLFG